MTEYFRLNTSLGAAAVFVRSVKLTPVMCSLLIEFFSNHHRASVLPGIYCVYVHTFCLFLSVCSDVITGDVTTFTLLINQLTNDR